MKQLLIICIMLSVIASCKTTKEFVEYQVVIKHGKAFRISKPIPRVLNDGDTLPVIRRKH